MRAIRRAALDLTLSGKRAQVVADGRYGRGDFDLRGQLWLDGLRPSVFRASADVDNITIPAGSMPADISADLTLRGRMTDRLLSATIDISRGQIELPDRKRTELHPVSPPEDIVFVDERKKPGEAPREERAIRLRLITKKGVRVRGEPLDALFSTDLTATRVRGQLSVVGTIRATRGTVTLFDRRYDIRRAVIAFDGEMPPNPDLDMRLERDFEDATVSIDVTGTARAPRVALASNPPTYDETQLIGLVVTGSPSSGTAETASVQGAAAGAASALLGKQVYKILERTLPIDTVRLASGENGSETTFVLVGKWVNDELFVAYRRSILEEQENDNANEALIEYHITRQWLIEGHYGDAGEGGADVLWTVRLYRASGLWRASGLGPRATGGSRRCLRRA
jgi:translocation and assembly module TamB